MKLYVLFGQRKCSYPGEYALEALSCMDENGQSDNPDYLQDEHTKYEATGEFDRLGLITLALTEADIRNALYPENKPIKATVVGSSDEPADQVSKGGKPEVPKGYSVFPTRDGKWAWESILSPESHHSHGFETELDAITHCRLSNELPTYDHT